MDFEMCVVDSQPATFGGANREFVFSPRLDNLLHTYCSITVRFPLRSCVISLLTCLAGI
jgi:aspartyl aminopeptidase